MQHSPGFLKLVNETRKRVEECSIAEAKAMLEGRAVEYFIDVREDHEFAVDHAKGAIHVGKGIIERDIETLVPDKRAPIIVYCGGGYRSVLAADALQQMGYTKVMSMDGGIKAWRTAGYPME